MGGRGRRCHHLSCYRYRTEVEKLGQVKELISSSTRRTCYIDSGVLCCKEWQGGGGGYGDRWGRGSQVFTLSLTVTKLELKVRSNHAVDLFRVSSSSARRVSTIVLVDVYLLFTLRKVGFRCSFLCRLK